MKHFEKTLKITALALAAFATISLTNTEAQAATCPEYPVIENEEITITPERDCLWVNIRGLCLERIISVDFSNHCTKEGTVLGTDFDGDFSTDPAPSHEIEFISGEEENLTYIVTVDGVAHNVNVVFTSNYQEDEGCSVTNTRPVSFFALLGFGLLLVRRKTRR